jgi:hypothetical protein
MTQFPQFMAIDQRPNLLRQAIELAHLEICEENRQPGYIFSSRFFYILSNKILVLPSNGFFFILKGGVTSPPITSQFPSLSSQMPTGPVYLINQIR